MDSNRNNASRTTSASWLQKLSLTITGSLENFFYNWGFQIATRPWTFIGACLTLTVLCSIGLLGFTSEQRPDKLWIPWNSDFYRNTDWLRANFPSPIRFHHVIITAENVLEPSIMELLLNLHDEVVQLRANSKNWEDLCFRLPVTKFSFSGKRRRKRNSNNSSSENIISADFADTFSDDFFQEPESEPGSINQGLDPSLYLPQEEYCNILEALDDACWESNPIELWNYNKSLVQSLTRSDILNAINTNSVSPVFGRVVNYTSEFGGIVRNDSGHIIQANAVFLSWFAKINQTAISSGDSNNDLGNGETVDESNLLWETELVKLLINYSLPQGVEMYFRVARSFGDISGSTIMNDASNFALGFSIVFIYVMLMLGKCNLVEQRPMLALAGLSCIGLAIVVSYGICSSFRLIYGPIHNVLPFLLLGIGIDDMFVIMQCWNNLPESEKGSSIPEKVGLALKHAGVSITVTSVTDFAAFVIGGTTVLPALQSFCIYAAFGVIATYIFQATFFTAWLSLDMKRAQQKRNAFLICYTHDENYVVSDCSQENLAQRFLGGPYSNILFSKVAKVMVILTTFGIAGVCVWGNTLLRQEFNPIWFLPQDTYLFKYFEARDKYFPGRGNSAMVIISNVTLHSNLLELDQLVQNLTSSKSVYNVDAWYPDFKGYVNKNFGTDVPHTELSERNFNKYLSKFLFSPLGSKYRGRFAFEGNLTCGKRAPKVKVSAIGFQLKTFKGPEEHIPAMHEVKDFVKNTNFEPAGSDNSFAWSFAFAGWETDEIITAELYRNMGLAMVCVLLTTLLLIANVRTCIMVLLCVILTLVDVLGGMYFWDLTIDTVSCIDLVLAIGLCVDYAAHIGHAFMTCSGTLDERARRALRDIGPAVLNGGFSTFLAFVLLANSKSHVFLTFYKIFFLVVVFGLFHGLVFLPVLLSVLGPPPYPSAKHQQRDYPQLKSPETEELNPSNGVKPQELEMTNILELGNEEDMEI